MNKNLENISFTEILFIFKKRISMIIFVTIIMTLLALILSAFVIKPKYQSKATLIVNASAKANENSRTYEDVNLSEKLVETYAIIMKSDPVLNQVISDLKLDTSVDELYKKIKVEGIGTTEIMQLTVTDNDPALAMNIAKDITKVAPDVIIKSVNAGSVIILSNPVVSSKPVSPDIPLYTLMGFMMGLVFSCIAAYIMELLDNTFKSDDDIKKVLGFNVLGVIPEIDAK